MEPRVSIIILNWNGWRDTVECLESVYRIHYLNYDVIVIDNASTDDSIQKIREYARGKIKVTSRFFKYTSHNKPIHVFVLKEEVAKQGKFNRVLYEKYDVNRRLILIKNEDNYGFAGGNNVGIKFALSIFNSDYILLLNNDVVVDSDFLIKLVTVAEKDGKIGIVGPKIYYYDYDGKTDIIWHIGGKLKWYPPILHRTFNIKDKGQFNRLLNLDFVPGAAMLIKTNIIKKIGLLSQEYFLQWEDIDYCIRAKKEGFKVVYTPLANVWHKVSASYIGSKLTYFQTELGSRNRILFWKKYLSTEKFFLFIFFVLTVLLPLHVIYYILVERDIKKVKYFLKGLIKGLFYPI